MNKFIYYFLFLIAFTELNAADLIVSANSKYKSIQEAAKDALPGDNIIVSPAVYNGGMMISNLKGSSQLPISIIAEKSSEVIIRGGSNAFQFSDAEYVIIKGLIFEGQTGNGLNIDDAGNYSSPTKNISIDSCTFRNMNASGNNDLLKLSGLDSFKITRCTFFNGAAGGSGIDMVGCHYGIISNNRFENMGSNAIQAKGGTQFITIQSNFFKNCGQRTLNLGGSTGLQYFRPIDAKFEAADLNVFSNIFIGSVSPINYVGSVRVKVINNTIINPEKWVIRILQETVDPDRFFSCGDNEFSNNLIYQSSLGTETNIGPNTNPNSFIFRNNFWFNHQQSNWQGPNIPVKDNSQIINQNPLFINLNQENFNLSPSSPAKSIINYNNAPDKDYYSNLYKNPRSAGAIEYFGNDVYLETSEIGFICYNNLLEIVLPESIQMLDIEIFDLNANLVKRATNAISNNKIILNISELNSAVYFAKIGTKVIKFRKN